MIFFLRTYNEYRSWRKKPINSPDAQNLRRVGEVNYCKHGAGAWGMRRHSTRSLQNGGLSLYENWVFENVGFLAVSLSLFPLSLDFIRVFWGSSSLVPEEGSPVFARDVEILQVL